MNLFIQNSSVFQKNSIPLHQSACKIHRTLAKIKGKNAKLEILAIENLRIVKVPTYHGSLQNVMDHCHNMVIGHSHGKQGGSYPPGNILAPPEACILSHKTLQIRDLFIFFFGERLFSGQKTLQIRRKPFFSLKNACFRGNFAFLILVHSVLPPLSKNSSRTTEYNSL